MTVVVAGYARLFDSANLLPLYDFLKDMSLLIATAIAASPTLSLN